MLRPTTTMGRAAVLASFALVLAGACSDEGDTTGGGGAGAGMLFGGSSGTGAAGGGPECTTASSCPDGAVCEPETETCVADLACTNHSECGGGAFCDGGVCARNTEGGPCDESINCVPPETCDNGVCGCGGELWTAENVPPNVLIVLDRSSSMDSDIGGGTKWEIALEAIAEMLASYAGGVRFGLMLYPGEDLSGDEGHQCGPGVVFVDPGPDTAGTINDDLDQAGTTSFGTPIGATLDTLFDYSGLEDTTRANYVLLITDGEENCDGDGVAAVTALRTEVPEIRTFVVGFGDEVDPDQLSAMAEAGGTAQQGDPAYYQCDDAGSLASAFASIAGSVLSCSYTLSEEPPDPNLLFVYADGEAIPRDEGHASGWDYDAATGQLTFYGAICDDLTAGAVSDLLISYGCPPPEIR